MLLALVELVQVPQNLEPWADKVQVWVEDTQLQIYSLKHMVQVVV